MKTTGRNSSALFCLLLPAAERQRKHETVHNVLISLCPDVFSGRTRVHMHGSFFVLNKLHSSAHVFDVDLSRCLTQWNKGRGKECFGANRTGLEVGGSGGGRGRGGEEGEERASIPQVVPCNALRKMFSSPQPSTCTKLSGHCLAL